MWLVATTGAVLVEHPDRDALERFRDGGDLGQHVDAVPVGLHHLLEAPDLALHAAEAGQQLFLGHLVTGHDRYYTPLG